jgi:hypothetical protein
MTGDDRVRFCDLCNLHVYNLAELTRTEAESLIANSEGRICARLYRRSDGTVITKDCPVGLRALRRRAAKVAGVVFAASMSLVGSVAGQKPASKDKSSCQKQVRITRKVDTGSMDTGVVGGTVLDPNGAVVAGAKIRITDRKTRKSYDGVSNGEGHFLTEVVRPGSYDISIQSLGFKRFGLGDVTLTAREIVSLDLVLLPDATSVTMGIIAETPLIDTSTPGTTIISGEMIRRLPIP